MEVKIFSRVRWAELLLLIGAGLFIGGAMGYVAGYLTPEQISQIAAMALILIGVGSSEKNK